MTVYFVPTTTQESKCQIMAECSDVIMTTADYFEYHYRTFGEICNVPMFTHKWLSHLIPRLSAHKIPLTETNIIGSAYFTLQIRIKFPNCDRNMFYFPKPKIDEEEQKQQELELEMGDDAFWDHNNFLFD